MITHMSCMHCRVYPQEQDWHCVVHVVNYTVPSIKGHFSYKHHDGTFVRIEVGVLNSVLKLGYWNVYCGCASEVWLRAKVVAIGHGVYVDSVITR